MKLMHKENRRKPMPSKQETNVWKLTIDENFGAIHYSPFIRSMNSLLPH
jgi:hypothetical protein